MVIISDNLLVKFFCSPPVCELSLMASQNKPAMIGKFFWDDTGMFPRQLCVQKSDVREKELASDVSLRNLILCLKS